MKVIILCLLLGSGTTLGAPGGPTFKEEMEGLDPTDDMTRTIPEVRGGGNVICPYQMMNGLSSYIRSVPRYV